MDAAIAAHLICILVLSALDQMDDGYIYNWFQDVESAYPMEGRGRQTCQFVCDGQEDNNFGDVQLLFHKLEQALISGMWHEARQCSSNRMEPIIRTSDNKHVYNNYVDMGTPVEHVAVVGILMKARVHTVGRCSPPRFGICFGTAARSFMLSTMCWKRSM